MSEEILFTNRVVIVTGSSRGIGRAVAEMFAEKGASVVVNGRSAAPVDNAVAMLLAKGYEVFGYVGDVATEAGANALVKQTIKKYGRIDVVVNNAGIMNYCLFNNMTASIFNEVMKVNIDSAFCVTNAAWPHMVKQKYGRVLMMTSQAIFGLPQGASHYSSSKAGLVGLMRSLSSEGQPHGITANAIMPFAATDMMSIPRPDSDDESDGLAEIDVTQLAVDWIIPPVAWLCDESCQVSGEILHVGGGGISRVFIAETRGFYDPNLSAESVRDNWTKIIDEQGYTVPNDYSDILGTGLQRMGIGPVAATEE